MAISYSAKSVLATFFIFAIVLSPYLPSDAAKEPINRPYCPACNCCKVEPPPPCCYCACSVITDHPENTTP
ncbi:hypothetical protein LOK49_LG14G01993 [Camellia lanceoleosa]|uniref:Uncharacterized protein n=1 Tax=Camellia lanceoleosa TaxID=1840588 RepID=A0ACC0F7S1_9ERIC|nr:hypothetical protein LOK49_LG14G01993 [Camellia lanceoleosa]